ncbi:MFS transporter [Bifidobacterium primatium]|uniref:MFS transporter n=1 Tax=Bifidobacterium primatium TaxID=2045438 RepID=UPI0013FDF8A7|nr:MFS transporter [Bifidobacterium primatium]
MTTQTQSEPQQGKPQSRRHGKITIGNALSYAMGDVYGGGGPTLAGTYLAVFWTHFCGFDISTAQGIIGGAAVVSAVCAILFGLLSERFYLYRLGRRFGRRRFFIMLCSPLVLVTLLMWVPGLPQPLYFALYVLYIVLLQMFGVCYAALPGEMTTDFAGRSMLSTVRLLLSGISTAVIPMFASWVLSHLGETNAYSYQLFATVVTVVFACVTFASSRLTWELTPEEAGFGEAELARRRAAAHRRTPREMLAAAGRVVSEYASTFRIATFRIHITLYLICLTLQDMFTQTFVFFVLYDWNRTAAFASLLLSLAIIAEVFKPLWGWLFIHIGPRNLYAVCYTGALTGLALLFLAWRTAGVLSGAAWTALAVAAFLVWCVFRSLSGTLPWLIFPFIPDVDMIVTKRNRASIFSGITTFLRFICTGVASIACGAFLATTGFEPNHAGGQSTGAQMGIAFVCLGWSAIGFLVAFVISRRFALDQRGDLMLLHEIDRLRSGGSKEDVEPEVRKTVEKLTGVPYERCWR